MNDPHDSFPGAALEIGEFCVAGRIRKLSRALTALYDEALRDHGIGANQLTILAMAEALGGVTPGELRRYLLMDGSTVSRNVARMCDRGWLCRRATEDGRSHRIVGTAGGRELLERALPAWREAQRQARELLGDEGFETIVRLANDLRGQPTE